jgi:hypothetical protein
MDPFVTLANRYVDSRPGLGHSALPNAPQLPVDDRRPSRSPLVYWRRLMALRLGRLFRGPVQRTPRTSLRIRSARMARGE